MKLSIENDIMQVYLNNRNNATDVGTERETKNCRMQPVTNHAEKYSLI